MNSFYTEEEVKEMGFRSVGHNVKISRRVSLYNIERIELGNHVRIDDFCVISACANGFVSIGNYVHIAAQCIIEATAGVTLEDFSGLAARCTIYGGSDDYSGNFLTNPMVPMKYRKCYSKPVLLKKHVVIGSGSTIMPGVILGEGSAVGSMSLVIKDVPPLHIVAGIPCRYLKERSSKLFELEEMLFQESTKERTANN